MVDPLISSRIRIAISPDQQPVDRHLDQAQSANTTI